MIEDIAQVAVFWQSQLAVSGLVFLRVGAAMALLPAFGEQSIPLRFKLMVAIAFTFVVSPSVAPQIPVPAQLDDWLRTALFEVLAGLSLGIALRLMVLALQIAGTIAANATSLSQILGGASVDPQPAIGHILVVAGLALATMAGLHVKIAYALVLSYDLLPAATPLPRAELTEWGTAHVGRAFALAFALSAPFAVASLIYNFALGAINRAMPQLMVAFVGAPAITMGGLVLLFLSAPILLALWLSAFESVLQDLGPPQ